MTLKISKWLFLFLIVSLPLIRPLNTIIFGLQVPSTDFIFLAVIAFWLLALIRRETFLKFDKFYIFIGLYAFALTISSIFSIQPKQSFFKLAGEFYLFALAVLTFNLVQEKQFYKQIAIAWLIGTGLTILASIAGFALFYLGYKTQADNYFLSQFGSLPAGNYPRIHALFANANMMCNFLNVSLMVAILAEKLNWLKKFWARILQTGIWFAAIFTFSSGLGGMVLSLGIWYWAILKEEREKFSKILVTSAILFALMVFGATLISPDTENTNQDFSLPFSDKKLEVSVRVLVWENAFETFRKFPIVGQGTGTNPALVTYQTLSGDKQILLDAHNNWLNILGQTGLLGLIVFILLNAYLLTRCRFNLEQLSEPNMIHHGLSCAFLGAFLYQGLSGSFEDARHLWILFGMLVGISNSTFSKTDISKASTGL
ncbi:MAG: O-antigen ligase family protein [Actinomycetota bacterium]